MGGLIQRVRHAHHRAAADLAFGQCRVDDAPDFIGALEAQDGHLAGLGIHLNLGHCAGVRLGRVGVHLAGLWIDVALGLHVHAAP